MQQMMSQLSTDPAASAASPEDIAKMGQELDEFTRKMEAEGIQPQDLLKAILGEDVGGQVAKDAENERERRESQSQSQSPAKAKSASKQDPGASKTTSFEETIRRTIDRLETSDTKATHASQESSSGSKSEDQLLADLLRSMDSDDPTSDSDLSKMFLNMMEQLTHKDMLYEPMKELDSKFPAWLAENKSKLSAPDAKRFGIQQTIVREIVAKFEQRGYSDDDPACREYIWDRMQRMQAEGSPPEDLVANPLPGMPDLGGGAGDDPGCPTQ